MELENIHIVAGLGFFVAMILGAVANRTNFCTMGAVSDWVNMGSKGRLAAWTLAMGIAIACMQLLEVTGIVDLNDSIYRTTNFGLGGYIVGGLLFGIGMTLGGGCGQRSLVRLGGGNLKSLVVVLVLGLTAYMTLRGILGVVRLELLEPLSIDLSENGIADQGLPTLIAHLTGWDQPRLSRAIVAIVVALALIAWSFKQPSLRENKDNILGGVVVGLAIVAAWIITAVVGVDDFDPVPIEGMSFVAPTGNMLSYLMTYTGSVINFGIAVVFGIIVGSFIYALASRTFSIETFSQRNDMINHLVGGALMGFGGVLSLGCTIGQGVTGLSTLALGSFVAVLSIIIGSAVTMRVQYYRLDDTGFAKALFSSIADVLLPWREMD